MNDKLINIYVNEKLILSKKLNLNDNLDVISKNFGINFTNSNLFTQKNGDKIEISEEPKFKIGDILIGQNKINMININPTPIELESKVELTDLEKKLIENIYEQDLPPEKIFNFLGIDHEKEENVKRYYFSLKKPVKHIPTNLKSL